MGDTEGWDKEHKDWSQIKDKLFSAYLRAFLQKVMSVPRHGILYVDGFAGPGTYDDGSPGSPLGGWVLASA